MLKFPLQILILSALSTPVPKHCRSRWSSQVCPGHDGLVQVCPGHDGLAQVCPGHDGLVQVSPGQDGLVQVSPGQYPSFWFHENLIAEIARQDTKEAFS